LKKYSILIVVSLGAFITLLSMRKNEVAIFLDNTIHFTLKKNTLASSSNFTIVELFTSEGCSSCPPADELVTKLVADKKEDIYVLSYHVDYWNRLGWKDEFSNSAFSSRQYAYATALGLDGVYTPQIIVNGNNQFTGSNESKLKAAIATKNQLSLQEPITATATIKDNLITVYTTAKNDTKNTLQIALVQLQATTQVKRGENEGLTLQHSNIVLELKSIPSAAENNTTTFTMPKGLTPSSFEVIAFLQNSKTYSIIAATKVSL
jgi:hypothetical protein